MIDNSNAVLAELKKKVALSLEAVGIQAEGNVAMRTPVDTGLLQGSWSHLVDDNKVTIGTNVKYATYVEVNDNARHTNGQAHMLRDGIQQHMNEYQMIVDNYLKR